MCYVSSYAIIYLQTQSLVISKFSLKL